MSEERLKAEVSISLFPESKGIRCGFRDMDYVSCKTILLVLSMTKTEFFCLPAGLDVIALTCSSTHRLSMGIYSLSPATGRPCVFWDLSHTTFFLQFLKLDVLSLFNILCSKFRIEHRWCMHHVRHRVLKR